MPHRMVRPDAARYAAPRTIRGVCARFRTTHLRHLPEDCLFEPMRCPLRGDAPPRPEDVFRIPDEDRFYLDLMGPQAAQDVLCADELRRRCHARLGGVGKYGGGPPTTSQPTAADGLLWLVTDVHDGSCRGAMEIDAEPDGAYALRALFVGAADLRDDTLLHECLLFALVGFLDYRDKELRVRMTATPLVCLLFAALGFLRDPDADATLLRPCLTEMVRSHELLRAVDDQFRAAWAAHTTSTNSVAAAPSDPRPTPPPPL